METQLKELIDQIKSEGVEKAEDESRKIIESAEARGSEIIKNAENRAEEIIENAKKEAARAEDFGKNALKQAGRDLLIQLNTTIQKIFGEIISGSVKEAYSEKVMEQAIADILKAWQEKGSRELEVLISKEELEKIETGLKTKLSEKLKSGIAVKPVSDIEAGFRISEKDGSAYYDFTHEGIAEILTAYMNPRLGALINEIISEGI